MPPDQLLACRDTIRRGGCVECNTHGGGGGGGGGAAAAAAAAPGLAATAAAVSGELLPLVARAVAVTSYQPTNASKRTSGATAKGAAPLIAPPPPWPLLASWAALALAAAAAAALAEARGFPPPPTQAQAAISPAKSTLKPGTKAAARPMKKGSSRGSSPPTPSLAANRAAFVAARISTAVARAATPSIPSLTQAAIKWSPPWW